MDINNQNLEMFLLYLLKKKKEFIHCIHHALYDSCIRCTPPCVDTGGP